MKNIHLIPTDKPSRLYKTGNFLLLDSKAMPNNTLETMNQHIYITSNEEIKEGDWVLGDYPDNPIGKVIAKYGKEYTVQCLNGNKCGLAQYDAKKIILTDNKDLFKDGVQAIDDEFLEWFVKNPSCEFVETERLEDGQYFDYLEDNSVIEGIYENYKIIIPKEEPKQETLEEYSNRLYKQSLKDGVDLTFSDGVKLGAKWQQEQDKKRYSEEEVLDLLHRRSFHLTHKKDTKTTKEWFEQFKKK